MEVEIVDIIAVGHVNKHFDEGKLTTSQQNGGLSSSTRKVRRQPQLSMLKTSQLLLYILMDMEYEAHITKRYK